ncbi:MAG: hypothetical protein LRY50_04690 [Geovibrio sp.]|nr:hypothetical protein [Geovibrio sp.]
MDVTEPDRVERKTPPVRKYSVKPLESAVPYEQSGYRLITGSHTAYLNSQIPPSLGENDSRVFISPETAAKEQLAEGDRVEISGLPGCFTGVAAISGDIPDNVVFAYKNRRMTEGYINNATPFILTDSGNGIAYYDTFVNIVRK